MKLKDLVGATSTLGDGIVMTCKAGMALNYGDVVKMGTQDTGPYLVVTQVATDDIGVIGVVSEVGGIASGDIGEVTVKGPAEMRCDSQTAWAANLSVNTNGTTLAGCGNDGTSALGKNVGFSMGKESGTVTLQTVYVNPS